MEKLAWTWIPRLFSTRLTYLLITVPVIAADLGCHPNSVDPPLPPSDAMQAPPEESVERRVLAWIREHAVVLEGADPSLANDDLPAFAAMLDDARVIGMGEGTHGTREFFQFRDRVIRWLAKRNELDAILWESEFVPSLDGEKALIDATVSLQGFGPLSQGIFWNTQENIALFEWVRQHNLSSETAVRFFGVDAFDLPSSASFSRAAARRHGGEALQALDAMEDALGTSLAKACAEHQTCYEHLASLSKSDVLQLAEGAAWLADVLRDSSPHWEDAVAARIVEYRVRHLLQFAQLTPDVSLDQRVFAASERLQDAQSAASTAAARIEETLSRLDPAYWRTIEPVVTQLPRGREIYRDRLDVAARYAWTYTIESLQARIRVGRYDHAGRHAKELLAAAGALRSYLEFLQEMLRTPPDAMGFDNFREIAMGETISAVARHLDGSGRHVFAAHNLHVGYSGAPSLAPHSAGWFARQKLGTGYLAIGTFFGEGCFQATDRGTPNDAPRKVRVFHLEPAPGSLEAMLMAAEIEAFALDLRQVPVKGPVARWFRAARATRDIGNGYDAQRPEDFVYEVAITDAFDVIVFFKHVERAVPSADALASGVFDSKVPPACG